MVLEFVLSAKLGRVIPSVTHHMGQNTDIPHAVGSLLQSDELVGAHDRHGVVLFTRLESVSNIFIFLRGPSVDVSGRVSRSGYGWPSVGDNDEARCVHMKKEICIQTQYSSHSAC